MSRNLYVSALTTIELELRVHHLEERVAHLEALLERAAARVDRQSSMPVEAGRPTA
jgi:hypothetical protein